MGYYLRVLGKNKEPISFATLQEVAHPAVLDLQKNDGEEWEQLILRHPSGKEIALIERNLVTEGSLGEEELQEFTSEVLEYKPASAAKWLHQYLPTVRVIYAFQILSGTEVEDGWGAVHSLQNSIWHSADGILQSDGEGFTNEDGYTILWQFSDTVSGPWYVAVLTGDSQWSKFQMSLGNKAHRKAFWQGQVPAGVKVL